MQDQLHRRCLLQCSGAQSFNPFLLLLSWKLFFFITQVSLCIMNITQRNSVILMRFVISVFSIEAIHRTVPFHTPALSSSALLSRASLASILKFNISDPLRFHGQQSSSLTDHLLYFWSVWLFRFFALSDLASKCTSSDATLNALAADAVNLLWHCVRPFCAAE